MNTFMCSLPPHWLKGCTPHFQDRTAQMWLVQASSTLLSSEPGNCCKTKWCRDNH